MTLARPQSQAGSRLRQRVRVAVRGAVQGVGFRPFIFRLAEDLGLDGWVRNTPQGVFIEVEGGPENLQRFLLRIDPEKPHHAVIQSLESSWLDPAGHTGFEILPSAGAGKKSALILPDIATCADCLREIFHPENRRYRYPFTNCTHCGPRFSIIGGLPYDRGNTTMAGFRMCSLCRAEYENPRDRRFHAQPNACAECGPHVELWSSAGKATAMNHEAIVETALALRRGSIVAVKGIGGFHLVVNALRADAVEKLRYRKHREEKPLAVMFPSLDSVRDHCEVSELEERFLMSPEAPIVLLRRRGDGAAEAPIVPGAAPDNPRIGSLLPYSPLHHLLMAELGFPVVVTSGNLSDEPICIDEREAVARLAGIADRFLIHDRPIARHVDDSVVRSILGRRQVLRRARGYAPLPVGGKPEGPPVLAVGGHLKNTVAVSTGDGIFLSQHIGGLDTAQAHDAFTRVVEDLIRLYECRPGRVMCDAHPDYASTAFAEKYGIPVSRVQHHHAHVLSCMAENELAPPLLGVAWDGAGYGPGGTLWGGEFLRIHSAGFHRAAHWRPFPLPGGGRAITEPRRAALGLLYEIFGDDVFGMRELAPIRSFSPEELRVLRTLLERKINRPITTSAGRLFDAVAALAGIRQRSRFEGQAAMQLEFALEGIQSGASYPFDLLDRKQPWILDWQPLVLAILNDLRRGESPGRVSARFHNTLAEAVVAVAQRLNEDRVVLTGGCFQNRYLTERTVTLLERNGLKAYWHQRVPPNDGGLALGQAAAASLSPEGEPE